MVEWLKKNRARGVKKIKRPGKTERGGKDLTKSNHSVHARKKEGKRPRKHWWWGGAG